MKNVRMRGLLQCHYFLPSKVRKATLIPATRRRGPFLLVMTTSKCSREMSQWFGLWLGRRLSFNTRNIHYNKARLVANHLPKFSNTQRNYFALLLWHAVHSCVILIATYGAEVQWSGDLKLPGAVLLLQGYLGLFNGQTQY